MPKTDKKPLELGRPRATAYMEILTKRLGKRKAAVIEGRARELAEQAGERVVRFEYVAEAAGVPLQDMLDELDAVGIKTRPKDVRVKASTNGSAASVATEAAKPAGKGGPGNARKATATRSSSKAPAKKKAARPAPTARPKIKAGSAKQNGSSRKVSARKGRAASSSASPKTDQLRRLREKQASGAR